MRAGGWAVAAAATGAAGLAVRRLVRRRAAVSFAGRAVLVTGGTRGLGLLMARELAAEGARLALVARDPGELAAARAELEGAGAEVLAVAADLTTAGEAERAVAAAVERFGGLDVLINNAGVIEVGPLESMSLDDFDQAMAIHFRAPLRLVLAALPHLARSGAPRIVNIASIGGRVAVPHLAPYCASKFALVGLSESLAAELAGRGIRVTTVCPGLMRTGSHLHARFKGRREREYEWFAVSASLPGVAMNARRAARRILAAARQGRPSLTLTPQARAAEVMARLAPATTTRAAALAARLLPSAGPDGETGSVPGFLLPPPRVPAVVLAAGERAARRNHERLAAPGRRG